MINTNKIKGRITEMGLTQGEVAISMKLNPSTFSRKINDESGGSLTVNETARIAELLEIEDVRAYFFT